MISIIRTKQCSSVTMSTCWAALNLLTWPTSVCPLWLRPSCLPPITIIQITSALPHLLKIISHYLLFSLLSCVCLDSQGLIAPMQWAVQVVWVKARGVLSVWPPTCQPHTRGKEPSPMTFINWWTTGPEMPWTSHRFSAIFECIF